MGTSEFSLTSSLVELLKQSTLVSLPAAYSAISPRCSSPTSDGHSSPEYGPVVTLVAVIGAYFAADGLQASGFMAVFVFGIMLGNKDLFGFQMEPGEAQKLDEYVATTAFIMRLVIFILLGSQVDFALMGRHLWGGIAVAVILMLVARPLTVFICAVPDRRAKWSLNEMLFMSWTRETGVIPAALAGLLVGVRHRRPDDRIGHFHRDPHDNPGPGPDHEMGGRQTGALGAGLDAGVPAQRIGLQVDFRHPSSSFEQRRLVTAVLVPARRAPSAHILCGSRRRALISDLTSR